MWLSVDLLLFIAYTCVLYKTCIILGFEDYRKVEKKVKQNIKKYCSLEHKRSIHNKFLIILNNLVRYKCSLITPLSWKTPNNLWSTKVLKNFEEVKFLELADNLLVLLPHRDPCAIVRMIYYSSIYYF